MKIKWFYAAAVGTFVWTLLSGIVFFQGSAWAHIRLRSDQPLRPGSASATLRLVVPNERHVEVTRISLEVPEAFRMEGGRLRSVEHPAGWEVRIEKQDKPEEIYRRELERRAGRRAGSEAQTAMTEEERQEEEIQNELLKQWITKVSFEGGSIPPDGSKQFLLTFQLPDEPGKYFFPALQVFADGTEISWSGVVEGAERPAAAIVIERQYGLPHLAFLVAALALLILVVKPHKRFKKQRNGQSSSAATSSVPAEKN
ncbi:MAG: DUF1775 domain-containing protein [Acidobacteria bacterium]|nr:DUF1775 domain-containing protein [Acidobacteriota bacterium]